MNFKGDFDFRKFYSDRDSFYWNEIEDLINKNNIPLQLIFKNYMSFIQRRDLPQLLAYYDLFKLVKNVPGSIAEVGVFLGNGLFTWTKLMETFLPGNRGEKVFGFDNFSGYAQEITKYDKKAVEYIQGLIGDFKMSYEIVQKLEQLHNLDSVIPGVERVKIYNGDLSEKFTLFKEENFGVRIKILLIDVNLYKPTSLALESLYDLVVPGGIVAFRGYGVKPWEGESLAVDEFIRKNGISKVSRFDFSNYPALYFIK